MTELSKDRRVRKLLDIISQFTGVSLASALEDFRRKKLDSLDLDLTDLIMAYGVVAEVNYASAVFSEYDNNFTRSTSIATEADASSLIRFVLRHLKLPRKFSTCAISYGMEPDRFQQKLEATLDKLHRTKLEQSEYNWLNGVAQQLMGAILVSHLPTYQKAKLPSSEQLFDEYANKIYGLSWLELRALKEVVNSKIRTGTPLINLIERGDPWKLANKFIVTPEILQSRTLEELVILQPTFFLTRTGQFFLHQFVRPIVYARCMAYDKMKQLARKSPNIEGDSLELFIQDYLGKHSARLDPDSPDYKNVPSKQFIHPSTKDNS